MRTGKKLEIKKTGSQIHDPLCLSSRTTHMMIPALLMMMMMVELTMLNMMMVELTMLIMMMNVLMMMMTDIDRK